MRSLLLASMGITWWLWVTPLIIRHSETVSNKSRLGLYTTRSIWGFCPSEHVADQIEKAINLWTKNPPAHFEPRALIQPVCCFELFYPFNGRWSVGLDLRMPHTDLYGGGHSGAWWSGNSSPIAGTSSESQKAEVAMGVILHTLPFLFSVYFFHSSSVVLNLSCW